jgi:hypothetical protein
MPGVYLGSSAFSKKMGLGAGSLVFSFWLHTHLSLNCMTESFLSLETWELAQSLPVFRGVLSPEDRQACNRAKALVGFGKRLLAGA